MGKAWSTVEKCSFNTATLETAYKVLLWWIRSQLILPMPTLVLTTTASRAVAIAGMSYIYGLSAFDRLFVPSLRPTTHSISFSYQKGC